MRELGKNETIIQISAMPWQSDGVVFGLSNQQRIFTWDRNKEEWILDTLKQLNHDTKN